MVTPRPSDKGAEIKPGMAMRCFYGIESAICDPTTGKEIEWRKGMKIEGALCFKKPWPGMARSIYGNHQRFTDTYYKVILIVQKNSSRKSIEFQAPYLFL